MKNHRNILSGEGLGIHEISEGEIAQGKGQELSEYIERRGPRFELPKSRPDLIKQLQGELALCRAKLAEPLPPDDEKTQYQAPEIKYRFLNPYKYKADFLSHLLVDGFVNTYELSRKYGKSGFDLRSFEGAIKDIEKLLEMGASTPKTTM